MCENNLSYTDLIKLVTLVTASRDRELFGVDIDLCNRLERLAVHQLAFEQNQAIKSDSSSVQWWACLRLSVSMLVWFFYDWVSGCSACVGKRPQTLGRGAQQLSLLARGPPSILD